MQLLKMVSNTHLVQQWSCRVKVRGRKNKHEKGKSRKEGEDVEVRGGHAATSNLLVTFGGGRLKS